MTSDIQKLGSGPRPLRVAIVGAGPAGFYAADHLLRQQDLCVEVDMFERLPAPFGLVRSGVAPDHQRIKRASVAFERTAAHPGFRFLGNVSVGSDVSVAELRESYDQVLFSTGSATDRRLSIPGEDLEGSHPATAFVGWYNAHPDFAGERYDLSTERVVVVGVGNVAIDVARILVRSPDELAVTDIAGYALDALRTSRVREVVMLGRRGPAEAAFDQKEISDIAELEGVSVRVDLQQILPVLERADELESSARRKVEYLAELARQPIPEGDRVVTLRFLASPVELLGEGGRLTSVRVEENELVRDASGRVRPRGTGRTDDIQAGMVLRSIGYHGVPIPGLPFDERSGTIPNREGRVTEGGEVLPGVFVAGWIKRGPTGLIGTNKSDAKETVAHMLEDARTAATPKGLPARDALMERLCARGKCVATFPKWQIIDRLEQAAGRKLGKVREKFSTVEAMIEAMERGDPRQA